MELWKPIPGFIVPARASSLGRVQRDPFIRTNGSRYQPHPTYGSFSYGYRIWGVRENPDAKQRMFSVHRLICMAFHGLPPRIDSLCLHLDENGLNNRPENLKWGDASENYHSPKCLEKLAVRWAERRNR